MMSAARSTSSSPTSGPVGALNLLLRSQMFGPGLAYSSEARGRIGWRRLASRAWAWPRHDEPDFGGRALGCHIYELVFGRWDTEEDCPVGMLNASDIRADEYHICNSDVALDPVRRTRARLSPSRRCLNR